MKSSKCTLDAAKPWLDEVAAAGSDDAPYRVAVVHRGEHLATWCRGYEPADKLPIASAAKSIYSSVLGIAVERGLIPSADARVVDYYPQMMDVPEGAGPKPSRHAFEANREITFRQLIGNTSGYMKPGEAPGHVFNYQTFGMNILTHALASVAGHYDTEDPRLPGFGALVDEYLAGPIGLDLEYGYNNFDHHPDARTAVFGNYLSVSVSLDDFVMLGRLWLGFGAWDGAQIVPRDWMEVAIRVNDDILANCCERAWQYGLGFWSNEHRVLYPHWDGLPRSLFMASGAGGHFATMLPEQELLVVQAPGPYRKAGQGNPGLVMRVLEALG